MCFAGKVIVSSSSDENITMRALLHTYHISLSLEAIEEIDLLSIAVFKAVQNKTSLEKLSETICLPDHVVKNQAEFLIDLGFLLEENDSLTLSQLAQTKLDLYQTVSTFNRSVKKIYLSTIDGKPRIPSCDNASFPVIPSLLHHKKAREVFVDSDEMLQWLKTCDGIPEIIIEELENVLGSDEHANPIFGQIVVRLCHENDERKYTRVVLDRKHIESVLEGAVSDTGRALAMVVNAEIYGVDGNDSNEVIVHLLELNTWLRLDKKVYIEQRESFENSKSKDLYQADIRNKHRREKAADIPPLIAKNAGGNLKRNDGGPVAIYLPVNWLKENMRYI